MRKIFIALLSTGMLAVAASAPQTFTGVITDTMCGANHKPMNMGSDSKCTQECVRTSGDKKIQYALYDGKNVYVLSDQQTPESFAGKRVTVTGVLFEKTKIIQVDKIEAAGK